MSNANEEIIRVCDALPQEKQQEVADFARFLLAQQGDERWEGLLPIPIHAPASMLFCENPPPSGARGNCL